MRRVDPGFGERVSEIVREHGLSHAQANIRTGIDRFTISQMMEGYVPRVEQVERFARGFGLDVNHWRELAGYERIESPSDTLLRGWDEICQEFPHLEIPFPLKSGGVRSLTQEAVEAILTDIRRKVGIGLYPERQNVEEVPG